MRRIRTRLIVAFLFVAILPAIPLSLVVRNLLERSFSPALNESLDAALEAGLAESRDRLRDRKEAFIQIVNEIWIPRLGSVTRSGKENILLLNSVGEPIEGTVPPPELSNWAGQTLPISRLPQVADIVRVEHFLAVAVSVADGGDWVVAQSLEPGVLARAERITDALALLRTLREDRNRVLRSYVAPFLLIYIVLILVAIGVGALLARWLARPIETLVASTEQVAAGDLDTQVRLRASGEIATLENSFNRMVTRLAQQRRELARLERVAAWRKMARTLAHEIKNPLTPILLAVQSACDGYKGDDSEHAALLAECEQIVREEVEGLRGLVREFSEFARLPQPQPVLGDLRDIFGELVRLYGKEKVDCEVPVGDLPARFDAGELRRALINLIDNGLLACKEAGRPERITLAVRPAASEVLIEVRDQGSGITPENLEHIFEPDFSTKKEGMGLGLCIVEGIVTGHDGTIQVASEPQVGTTFTIRLPHRTHMTGARSSNAEAGSGHQGAYFGSEAEGGEG